VRQLGRYTGRWPHPLARCAPRDPFHRRVSFPWLFTWNIEIVELVCHSIIMAWTVILVDEVADWYLDLVDRDPESAKQAASAINVLEAEGPALGRPFVDTIADSAVRNMKELRPGSRGQSEIRILFVFDPARQAVLLVAGDKSGQWDSWYRDNIPVAERRYAKWLAGGYGEERGV
jgi:hypothetical protein